MDLSGNSWKPDSEKMGVSGPDGRKEIEKDTKTVLRESCVMLSS